LHPQNTVEVKDKIEILCSRITVLVELFEKPAGDEIERKRREGLLKYVDGVSVKPGY